MSGKTILITGCSSGIGRCVAHGLKARGWRVFATTRQPADVARLQAEGLESLPLDLRDSTSIRMALAAVLERTEGRLDALVNNGAYGQPGAVEDLSRAALREHLLAVEMLAPGEEPDLLARRHEAAFRCP